MVNREVGWVFVLTIRDEERVTDDDEDVLDEVDEHRDDVAEDADDALRVMWVWIFFSLDESSELFWNLMVASFVSNLTGKVLSEVVVDCFCAKNGIWFWPVFFKSTI